MRPGPVVWAVCGLVVAAVDWLGLDPRARGGEIEAVGVEPADRAVEQRVLLGDVDVNITSSRAMVWRSNRSWSSRSTTGALL